MKAIETLSERQRARARSRPNKRIAMKAIETIVSGMFRRVVYRPNKRIAMKAIETERQAVWLGRSSTASK